MLPPAPKANQKLRYIAGVPITVRNGLNKEVYVCCDTPGIGDTAGPEVDIANGDGIIEALQQCKSVNLVVVIPYSDLDRMLGIKPLACALVDMVSNIADHIGGFSYVFTKVPQNQDIHARIKEFINQGMNEQEKANKVYVAVFRDILDKTEEGVLILDPLHEHAERMVRKLIKSPIQHPDKVFKPYVSEKSNELLKLQVEKQKNTILQAVKNGDYRLVYYKMNEWYQLHQLLPNQSFIQGGYQHTLNQIKETWNAKCKGLMGRLENEATKQQRINEKTLQGYQELYSIYSNA